jgi:hypothetical protein
MADDSTPLSVRFGNLCIQVEHGKSARERPAAVRAQPKRPAATIRCAPTAMPARQSSEYATVCASALCWHCCGELDNSATDAKRMPTDYNKTRRLYRLVGYFCRWECLKAYSIGLADGSAVGRRTNLLTQLAFDLYGELPPYVQAAPPRVALLVFGGRVTPHELAAAADDALNARPFASRLVHTETGSPGDWFGIAPR